VTFKIYAAGALLTVLAARLAAQEASALAYVCEFESLQPGQRAERLEVRELDRDARSAVIADALAPPRAVTVIESAAALTLI